MQLLKLLLVALVGGGNAWRSVVHARRVAASTSALSQTTGADDDPPSFPIQSVRSAARMGDADTLRQLVQGWSNHPGLNNRVGDIMGLTPLHWSVAAGQAKGRRACVEALLQAGCDVDAVNNSGNTALMYACATGKIECVEALLAGGAQVGRTGLYGQVGVLPIISVLNDPLSSLLSSRTCPSCPPPHNEKYIRFSSFLYV